MSTSNINWEDNHYKLIWTEGELKGFYIDFTYQEVGFVGRPSQRIERRKLEIIKYLFEHSDQYITGIDINMIEELNSVNVSKAISSVKSSIVRALSEVYEHEECMRLYEQIMDKKKTNGHMGYRLLTDTTSFLNEGAGYVGGVDSSTADTKMLNSPQTAVTSDDLETSDGPMTSGDDRSTTRRVIRGFVGYLKSNWFVLFVLLYIFITCFIVLDAKQLTLGLLIKRLIDMPLKLSFAILIISSIIPIAAGLLIDTPIALLSYHLKNRRKADSTNTEEKRDGQNTSSIDKHSVLTLSKLQDIVMHREARFDISSSHLIFFTTCNVTGAMSVSALILYVSKLPHFTEYISDSRLNTAILCITFVGIFVALYNNYMLQTKAEPARNCANYKLTRAHAFCNTLYLSFSVSLLCVLVFGHLLFGLSSSYANPATLNSAYIIFILAAYSYIWFSASSPMADLIDSISGDNFISGAPIFALFSVLYTLRFTMSTVSVVSLLINGATLAMWLSLVLKKRSVTLLRFTTSFFSCMAISVIVMLIINM